MNNPIARELLDSPPVGPCSFEMYRFKDVKGIASRYADQPDGKVMEGFITTRGKVLVQWLSRYSSTIMFDSWEDFVYVHVHPHTDNETMIQFYDTRESMPTRVWPAWRQDELVDRILDCALETRQQ